MLLQGYGDRGGAGHEEAWQLWGKAGLTDAFPQAWALADVDRDNRLNAQVGHTQLKTWEELQPHPALQEASWLLMQSVHRFLLHRLPRQSCVTPD